MANNNAYDNKELLLTKKVRHPSTHEWIKTKELIADHNNKKPDKTKNSALTSKNKTVNKINETKNCGTFDKLEYQILDQYTDDEINLNNELIDTSENKGIVNIELSNLNSWQYNYLGHLIGINVNYNNIIGSIDPNQTDNFKYQIQTKDQFNTPNPFHILPELDDSNINNNIDIFNQNDYGYYGKLNDTFLYKFNFFHKINNEEIEYKTPIEEIKTINLTNTLYCNLDLANIDISNYGWQKYTFSYSENFTPYLHYRQIGYPGIYCTESQYVYFQNSNDDIIFSRNNNIQYALFDSKWIPYFQIKINSEYRNVAIYRDNYNHPLIYFVNIQNNLDYPILEWDSEIPYGDYDLNNNYDFIYRYPSTYPNKKQTDNRITPSNIVFETCVDGLQNINNIWIEYIWKNNEEKDTMYFSNLDIDIGNYFVTITGNITSQNFNIVLYIGNTQLRTYIPVAPSVNDLVSLLRFINRCSSFKIYMNISNLILQNYQEILRENIEKGWYIGNLAQIENILSLSTENILKEYNLILKYQNKDMNQSQQIYNLSSYSSAKKNLIWNYFEKQSSNLEEWEDWINLSKENNQTIVSIMEQKALYPYRNKVWLLNNSPKIYVLNNPHGEYTHFIKEEDLVFDSSFIDLIKEIYSKFTINYSFDLIYNYWEYPYYWENKIRYYDGNNKLINKGDKDTFIYLKNGEFVENNIAEEWNNFSLLDAKQQKNNIDTAAASSNNNILTVEFVDPNNINNKLQEITFDSNDNRDNIKIKIIREGE